MSGMSNAKIRIMDMPVHGKVFGMKGGSVLHFVNRTFDEFFREELQVNIYDSRWAIHGGSKARRLRYYLRQANRKTALDTLNALWEYREASSVTHNYPELDDSVRVAFSSITQRLGGTPPTYGMPSGGSRIDAATVSSLAGRLLDVSKLNPQPRGYAFEKFLKGMFDAFGLSARTSIRLVGEQIDGSFVLGSDTFLLEAKWANCQVGSATLRSLNAKVEEKARWPRGLLLSYSGFSPDGLAAFGRGKSVICMDGRDMHDVLSHRLDFAAVLAMKVRWAAETGQSFASVDDLVPLPSP